MACGSDRKDLTGHASQAGGRRRAFVEGQRFENELAVFGGEPIVQILQDLLTLFRAETRDGEFRFEFA